MRCIRPFRPVRPTSLTVLLAGALAILGPATMATAQTEPDAPTAIEDWSLEKVSALGDAIYRQDHASRRAYAFLIEQSGGSMPPEVGGSIVVGQDDQRRVRFLDDRSNPPTVFADVYVPVEGDLRLVEPEDRALPPRDLAQFRARHTAWDNMGPPCGSTYNTFVLPDPDSEDWLVWFLAYSEDPAKEPVGGHYRFRVSPDGLTLKRRDALFRTCLTMDMEDSGDTVGMVVTHIVSPRPVETHVYISRKRRHTVYVATSADELWAIDGTRFRQVDLELHRRAREAQPSTSNR